MEIKSTVSVMALSLAFSAVPVLAQEQAAETAPAPVTDDTDGTTLAEVVVTAQKRSEGVNSVPLAISALSADELVSRGIQDTSDLTKAVPSFNVLKSAYGQPIYYIRGVGFADVTVSISPAVTIYTDEAPLPYSTMARAAAFDLERVEILKGPQGTLFGQNSTGGAVNYIAAKPTAELAAGVDLEAARFGAVNAGAYMSGPLSDTVRARVAVQQRSQDDWQRGLSRGDERGEQRLLNGRAIVDWMPSDALKFELSGSAWHDTSDTQAPQFLYFAPARTGPAANQTVTAAMSAQSAAPRDQRAADWDAGARTDKDDRFHQVTLRGDYEIGLSTTLTSISAYADAKIDSPVDVDGSPYPNAYFIQNARLKTFSQELRLDGSLGERTRWLVGVNYQDAKTDELLDQIINSTNNTVGPLTYNHVLASDNQKVDTYAGFASLERKLTDSVTLRASGRYTSEKRDFDGCLADSGDGNLARAFSVVGTGLAGQPVTIAPGSCVTFDDVTRLPLPTARKSLDQENVSWRTGIDWKINPDTLVYVNVARGYKSGGFTAIPAIFERQLTPVTQESVLAYEGGIKATLLQHRVQLNLAGFYYDYEDKQLQGYVSVAPFGPLPTLVNIPTSRVYGAEADLTARLTQGLTARLSAAYLDTEATSVPAIAVGPLGGTYDFSGESFPNTPKYQATADLEQRFPLNQGTEVYIGAAAQYRSSASGVFGSTQNDLTRSLFTIDSYTLVDVRAGVSFDDGRLTTELWGRNITDRFYVIGLSRTVDSVFRFTGMPATYGARVSWRF